MSSNTGRIIHLPHSKTNQVAYFMSATYCVTFDSYEIAESNRTHINSDELPMHAHKDCEM